MASFLDKLLKELHQKLAKLEDNIKNDIVENMKKNILNNVYENKNIIDLKKFD